MAKMPTLYCRECKTEKLTYLFSPCQIAKPFKGSRTCMACMKAFNKSYRIVGDGKSIWRGCFPVGPKRRKGMPTFHCRECDKDKAACLFNQAQHSKTEGSRICMTCQSAESKKYRKRRKLNLWLPNDRLFRKQL